MLTFIWAGVLLCFSLSFWGFWSPLPDPPVAFGNSKVALPLLGPFSGLLSTVCTLFFSQIKDFIPFNFKWESSSLFMEAWNAPWQEAAHPALMQGCQCRKNSFAYKLEWFFPVLLMLELCRGKIYNLPRLNSLSIKNWISPLNWNVQHWAGSSIKTRLGWSCQWLLEQSPRRKCWVTSRECCQFDTTLPDCHWICSRCAVKFVVA